MEMPKGFKTLKKRAKIPIVVEGEKKPRAIYTVPEINTACELMKEMAEALENLEIWYNPAVPLDQFNIKVNHIIQAQTILKESLTQRHNQGILKAKTTLEKFKEWK